MTEHDRTKTPITIHEVDYRPGVRLTGRKVLILPDPAEETIGSGILVKPENMVNAERCECTEGLVIDVGHGCWDDQAGKLHWCKVGDRVVFAKHRGLWRQGNDGLEYLILSDLDIIGQIISE